MTVRDFTQVFDSYAQFEESMIAAKMETASELGREEEDDVDLELRLARFEQLISRRPLLLNSVLLRQNPHHVHEWHKRVALHQGRPREVCDCSVPSELCPPPHLHLPRPQSSSLTQSLLPRSSTRTQRLCRQWTLSRLRANPTHCG